MHCPRKSSHDGCIANRPRLDLAGLLPLTSEHQVAYESSQLHAVMGALSTGADRVSEGANRQDLRGRQ